jgi:hypothetical protein
MSVDFSDIFRTPVRIGDAIMLSHSNVRFAAVQSNSRALSGRS